MQEMHNSWHWLALYVCTATASAVLGQDIDLLKDDPATLIGTSCDAYTIFGLRLGMKRRDAQKVLDNIPTFTSKQDRYVASKVLVFKKNAGQGKSNEAMALVWDKKEDSLNTIFLYPDLADSLAPNFRRLFTEESIDQRSSFKKEYIGTSNRSAVTLDVPALNMKQMTYYHDDIGLELSHLTKPDGNVIFVGLKSKGKAKSTSKTVAQIRDWSDATGNFKVKAELVKSDGTSVTLRKEDKKEIVVPISRLSEADRKYLESRSK